MLRIFGSLLSLGRKNQLIKLLNWLYQNAERALLKENRKKENKALGLIQQGLSECTFPKISSAESSKKAWDTLETFYQGVTKVMNVKLQNLRRDFENLKMKYSENVDNFMTQFRNVVNQLR